MRRPRGSVPDGASYNGPFSNGLVSQWCYHWSLQPGLWRALLRHVGAWVLFLPGQMAQVLALLKTKWHGEDPLSASRGGLNYSPGGMAPSLRPSGMVRQTTLTTSQADLRPTMAEAIPARAGQSP